jgi:hypothetical protein
MTDRADLAEACADLSTGLSELHREIARLDERYVDTHKLRNILQAIQLNASILIDAADPRRT